MLRRDFLKASAALRAASLWAAKTFEIAAIERPRVLRNGEKYIKEAPVTVTASSSPRSAGGKHDYFSEGDYWWPDPANPGGPYIQRDGVSNPDNFNDHRSALIRLSLIVPAMAAAYTLTHDRKYADHGGRHLRAWFVDEKTRMNPNLQYAQAVHGRFTGRGTGIIDTLHLVEVARATPRLDLPKRDLAAIQQWFAEYVEWMNNSENGKSERDAKNNHGVCWVTQVAAFAQLTGDAKRTEYCRNRFKTVLIPNQEAADGSFPEELRRTKPYSYSLFNLEALSILAQTLTTSEDNLWTWQLPDGRGMKRAMSYMYPFIADKSKWSKPPDVMYFQDWPVRQQSLLFSGLALNEPKYLELWKKLDEDPTVEEVIRNWPVRQPILWVGVGS